MEPDSARPGRASPYYLVVDARERAVIPFIESAVAGHVFIPRQINTGDYLICRRGSPPAIVACIERKSHEDFAASFRDGRYENFDKMRALRDRTGCQLYLFMEGAAFPAPGRKYSRIPYANILAAATKLMVRDGVMVVFTEDESHTARRLAEFLAAFDALKTAPHSLRSPNAHTYDEVAGGEPGDDEDISVPGELTSIVARPDEDAAMLMWTRLRGVAVPLGKLLTAEFSVAELVSGAVSEARIRALKTATGRAIYADAARSLIAVRGGDADAMVKLMSGLKGITPAAARVVFDALGSAAAVCAAPAAALEMVQIPGKKTVKFGKARAALLRRMLHWKVGAAPPPEPPGHQCRPSAKNRAVAPVGTPPPDAPPTISDADILSLFE
jgi:ERCC4-type nuclease